MRSHHIRIVSRALWTLVLLACATGAAQAGSDERKGTSGAHELRLGVGPRGSALGSPVVADVSGIEAMFWNPAGIAGLEGTEAMFTHQQYFAEMDLNYAALATRWLGGVLGFDAKVLSIGDIIVTTEDAPQGTGEILNPTFAVIGVTYGRQFTDRVLFGGTLHYVNEAIGANRASGLAFDFGVQYLTGWHGMKLGMAMQNFGQSMEFTGSDFETNLLPPDSDPQASNRTFSSTSASFEMPSSFALAASYDAWAANQQRLAIMGSFQNNNFELDNFGLGAEWSYRDLYALRGSWFGEFGTVSGPDDDSSLEFHSGNDLYSGYALGAAAAIKTGDVGKIGIEVAWRPVQEFFDDVLEVGIKFRF
jgi:hypothetical protein